jgi:hypothetical protein
MRASGVIVRFLSLLDVALILLGFLMITLMQAQLRSSVTATTDEPAALANLGFVYLYVSEQEPDKCRLLGPDREVLEEVRTDTPDDLRKLLSLRAGDRRRKNDVVVILFSQGAWTSSWTAERFAQLRRTWGVEVVPVYNVRLERR